MSNAPDELDVPVSREPLGGRTPKVDWGLFTIEDFISFGDAHAQTLNPAVVGRFGDRLQAAAERVTAMATAEVDRISGFRSILQTLHYALERGLAAGDPYHPVFSQPWRHHIFDMGAGNPDAVYRTTAIRGDATYRIHGRVGTAEWMGFEVRAGQTSVASVNIDDIEIGVDGRFEFWIGGERRDGPWWGLPPEANGLLAREFFADWKGARRTTFQIQCLTPRDAPSDTYDPGRVIREFEALGDYVHRVIEHFGERVQEHGRAYPNAFDPKLRRIETNLPVVMGGRWDLQPDECLVIEAPAPSGRYWSLHGANAWFTNLDHVNRLCSINLGQAVLDADGSFRCVVAHSDPGVANWIDTLGHKVGVLLQRQVGSAAYPVPKTRVVRTQDLGTVLPNARRVTPAQRAAELNRRRKQIQRLLYA